MAELCSRVEPLGYFGWHAKAERLHKAGLRQMLCGTCGLWRFVDEQCERFKPASAELLDEIRRSGGIV